MLEIDSLSVSIGSMQILRDAGLPDGVINMLPGHGADIANPALDHPVLMGVHFTGSTNVFKHIWKTVGTNIENYYGYPRIVGETGGKDFVIAHPSADTDALHTALIRGAFDYQGQKCSAASRASRLAASSSSAAASSATTRP